jgi:GNAT superfamily N-acetyltransferase
MGRADGERVQPSIPAMEQDDAPTGRHALGPHVVGLRVVVRRVVPGETGPSGGPALTDVLGICEAWAGGVATVRREDGSSVEIPTRDIVSGKPVPPRPSARMRVSPRDAEGHAAPLWPQVERLPLGEWELRTDPAPVDRLRKRANSCLAVGDPGHPLPEAIEAIRSFYADRDRDALAQVLAGSTEEAAFLGAGWRLLPHGEAELRLAGLATLRRRLPPVDDTAVVTEDGPRVRVDVEPACGEAALDGDWLGVHSMVTEPAHRRRGLARRVLAALAEWGAEQGATTLWLHVETDNPPARALYESLGLRTHHICRYYASP